MSATQKNKNIVRQLYEQGLNKRNMELLKDLVSENYIGSQGEKGAAAFEKTVAVLIKAFPDIQWKVEDLIAEEDKVTIRWSWQGTHTASFRNFAATGKTVTNTAIAIYELKDGKVINVHMQTDRLGFLQELEAIPPDVTTLSNKKAYRNRVSFIDKFFVPAAAKKEFYERMQINRAFIRKIPGFIEDAVYEYTDADGNLSCITVAHWTDREAFNKAKEAVQAEYQRQGFNAAEMFKRLDITADRGIYTEMDK